MVNALQPHRAGFVHIISNDEFENKSDGEILNLLRSGHILVNNIAKPRNGFDQRGLRKLASLTREVTIHGMYFRIHRSRSFNEPPN